MVLDDTDFDEILEVIIETHDDMAGSELLSRAFVAERNKEKDIALFWTRAYLKLTQMEAVAPRPNFTTPKIVATKN